jgi:hydroxymethylglutaryl-CoA synthase
MVGITAIGTYIPQYRLKRDEIARFWKGRSSGGEKAVAGYDEDPITLAVAATLDCLKGSDKSIDAFYFATTTAPYKEKQSAAIIASVADFKKNCHTADCTTSLRASTIALKSALDAIKAKSIETAVITAADCRLGATTGNFEQTLGDAAVSVMLGSHNVIASVEASYSVYSDFTDYWRTETDQFVHSAEGRFIDEVGYMPMMQDTISTLLSKNNLKTADFAKVVYYAADSKQHRDVAKRLGFQKPQIQDPLYDVVGNSGTAAAFLMLSAALESANAGDKILLVTYGDGCDAFVLKVTEEIASLKNKKTFSRNLQKGKQMDYGRYISWRELAPVESSTLPERDVPSIPSRWRERKGISGLYGFKCKKCGTPQLNPIGQNMRKCVVCYTQDQFEPYKFSDKTGIIFSYAIDQLQQTRNPPGVNGVIDFDGGGRLLCEFTDYDVEKIAVGLRMEMTFRKMYQIKGINYYFWKATPIKD